MQRRQAASREDGADAKVGGSPEPQVGPHAQLGLGLWTQEDRDCDSILTVGLLPCVTLQELGLTAVTGSASLECCRAHDS